MRTPPLYVYGWAAGLVGFAAMALLASSHETFPGDVWLAQHLQRIDFEPFRAALDYTEDGADLPWLVPVWLACAAALFATPRWEQALGLAAGVSGRLVNSGLKEVGERA